MSKVGAYQGAPLENADARKAQLQDIVVNASKDKLDFLCLPEGFLTGYYQEEELARVNSLEVDSTIFQEWLQFFAKSSTTYIVGFTERVGTLLFDSAAIIENGTLLGVQRKHFLYHPYFTPSPSFTVYQSKGICFGVAICLDMNYFEPARLLALQGATILFSPMCNKVALHHPFAKRPSYYSHFVTRAFENRCWLVAADWIYPSDGSFICPGNSVIYDPDGKEVVRSQELVQDQITVEIPKDRLFNEKGRRISGSPELFQAITKLAT